MPKKQIKQPSQEEQHSFESKAILRCNYRLRSLASTYREEALELGVHEAELKPDDLQKDFEAFAPAPLREALVHNKPVRFGFMDSNGELKTPEAVWSAVRADAEHLGDKAHVRRQRPRGGEKVRAGEKFKRTKRGGRVPDHLRDAESWKVHQWRLMVRALANGQLLKSANYSIALDGSHTQTGWQGKPPPVEARAVIRKLYSSGRIKEHLKHFFRVHYDLSLHIPAILLDSEDCIFVFRSSIAFWLRPLEEEFWGELEKLLGPALSDDETAEMCKENARGPHMPCILGIYRQFTQAPALTLWHRTHMAQATVFINSNVILRITRWVSQLVRMAFPGVAARFEDCAKLHNIEPQFGLFFNLCINGMIGNQKRIFCLPHSDAKNVVGVCVLVIYQKPGANFNHKKRSWLVLWEAGVIIELPPWVMLAYPSSLLYHFNVDIHDIEFVTTDGDEPTPENSSPIEEGDEAGRGSLVYFNEASMYMAETGYPTIQAAKKAGHSGVTDYGACAKTAFFKHATFVPMAGK